MHPDDANQTYQAQFDSLADMEDYVENRTDIGTAFIFQTQGHGTGPTGRA